MAQELHCEFGEVTYKYDVRNFHSDEVLAYIDRGFLMVNAMHKSQSSEMKEGSFKEKISLPADINPDSLQVHQVNGLLTVKLRRVRTTLIENPRNYEREQERERETKRRGKTKKERERERERERQRERKTYRGIEGTRERESVRENGRGNKEIETDRDPRRGSGSATMRNGLT